jgi:F-type H+-transporting ATPase subunit a
MSYTYLSPFIESDNLQKYLAAGALATVLIVGGAALTRDLRAGKTSEAVIPTAKPTLFGVVDLFLEGFINFHDSVLGKENRKHVPFVASVFIFLLLSNLVGLIPGVPAIATTVWVNVALAIVVFIYFNTFGVLEHGVLGYLKHFGANSWIIFLILAPLEILSTFLRILTLNLRLYWNITADHVVVHTFTELTKVGVPVVFYALGTFVSFMQAFIFTMLTMVYILLATQHGEEH